VLYGERLPEERFGPRKGVCTSVDGAKLPLTSIPLSEAADGLSSV
jgi:hypothetical protein